MNDVEADLKGVIATNCTWKSFSRICSSHGRTHDADGFWAFDNTHHYRARGDVLDKSCIEGLAFVDTIVLLGEFWCDVNELEACKLEASLLKTRINIAVESALD